MRKHLFSVFLLVAAAFAQTAPAPVSSSAPAAPNAANPWLPPLTGSEDQTVKKARNLLTQMIEAMGGQNYMDIRTVEQTGLSYSSTTASLTASGRSSTVSLSFPTKSAWNSPRSVTSSTLKTETRVTKSATREPPCRIPCKRPPLRGSVRDPAASSLCR